MDNNERWPTLLFNLYIYNMPEIKPNKFQYNDDTALVYQYKDILKCEQTLVEDLETLRLYFKRWKLKLNPTKKESIIFHLNNRQTTSTMNITFGNQGVQYNFIPKYLIYYFRPIPNI